MIISTCFLVACFGSGQSNAIILIPRTAVSRAIQPESYNHGLWIQWPDSIYLGYSRLLSPSTGLDWGTPDQAFQQFPNLLKGEPNVFSRDIRRARLDWIGSVPFIILQDPTRPQDPNIAALAAESGAYVDIAKFRDDFKSPALVLYSAASWDDVAHVEQSVKGNAIVISYPPSPYTNLSAAWLKDNREEVPVPTSTHVPGLVPAREIVPFLSQPQSYTWRKQTGITAEQWMSKIVAARPTQLMAFFVFAFLVAMWALRSVAAEKGGRLARFGISMVFCAFVALLWAGDIAKLTGLMAWNILPFFAYFGLLLGLLPVYLGIRGLWPKAHLLFPIALFATFLLLWIDPLYSVFSNVFTLTPLPVSPIALGALIAALTATSAFAIKGELWPRIFAALALVTAMSLGVIGGAWWAPNAYLLAIPVLGIVAGAGVMRVYVLPIFVVWPFLFHRWNGRFAWDVNWLLQAYSDRYAINSAAHVQFLLSPLFLITLVLIALVPLLGGDFLRHQMRRAFAENNAARSLFWASLAVACMGLREPYLLTSALIVLIVGFFVWLFDAAGSL